MAADLSEQQIEELLSAAEVSLANKSASVATKQQNVAVLAKAAAAAEPTVVKAGKDAVKPSQELSLRVPTLKVKGKKVCQAFFLKIFISTPPTFQ